MILVMDAGHENTSQTFLLVKWPYEGPYTVGDGMQQEQ
jgi:hypothetical protein